MEYEDLNDSDGLRENKVLKIIIVGDSNVGKTCLTYRFCQRSILKRSESTIGVDFYEKTVHIGENTIKLQIWDTAGQERFRKSMVRHYYRNASAVVIVYDVTKMRSFNSVRHWIDECTIQGLDARVPRVIVGTHCDLIEKRVVGTFHAQRFADSYGIPLFETSTCCESEMETIDAIFMTLAHKLINHMPFKLVSIDERPRNYMPMYSFTRTGSPQTTPPTKKCC